MVRGVGCDLAEVGRIGRALENPRFLEKVYTAGERAYLESKSPETAAGLWAAKEAVSKALGTGFTGFAMTDIEICRDRIGRPWVQLHGPAARLLSDLGGGEILVSISHDGGHALAFAVLGQGIR